MYQELVERIRGEMADLERVVQRAERLWPQARILGDQNAYVDSVALNLHGFYSGVERLFEQIARQVDRELPTGETWHRDLLRQMAQDQPEARPAVISQGSALVLDKFRRFRHLVRNVYTMNLTPDKMEELMIALPEVWSRLRAELLAFADFLTALDQPDEGDKSN